MALRKILTIGDDTLYKKCKKVTVFDSRLHSLLEDMKETLYNAEGAGLAAIQLGILKRVVVIDVGEGLIELINPEIIEAEGAVIGQEGCLSIPGKWGDVERPQTVKVKAQDRNGKTFTISGSNMMARALCHEIEHLDGILYIEKATNVVDASTKRGKK